MKYKITIQATVTKDILVEAEDIDEAYNLAHEQFDCSTGGGEKYEEETLNIEEIA